ncbi:coiled-coil domain-containing protein 3-like isoform X1 [Acanthaster planci]|uniref:Coiled-coil domain-containing protein 3-like isoform X1 n=1 Tax=Acanthaster planci TaxID=133434 RepID=A0A8B7YQU8_ACAPL|nr:coiled-coil domain-containing protein 3-like isoform X1 [Acanthaster planci]XP_022094835.1 coiled-coil domain-containing protein 3-like isoform X1 [Acanthaster planci]
MTRFQLLSVVVAFMVFCRGCQPCKVVNWRPKTVAEQAAEAEIIVYGTITEHYPLPDVPLDRAYIAEMNVTCNLKGEVLPSRINISEAGKLTSCHHTLLPVDGTYFTFLERNADGNLVPDEVNHLSVAFPPTKENVQGVAEAVGNLEERCPQLHERPAGYRGGDDTDGNGTIRAAGSFMCIVVMVITAITESSLHF